MLRVEGLRKSYGDVVALAGVDLALAPGEICGLLGPNGAGKTTLVSIVAGLRHANAGKIAVNGIDALQRSNEARKHIGLAPQDLGIYPTLTGWENLLFFGELAGVDRDERRRRVDNVAAILDLGHLLDRRAKTLSGGEKRRLHTAMAMLHRPPLLLLDEPTSGVDVATRRQLLDAVRRLAAEEGTTVCYSTHYLPEVEALGASVAIIDYGQIIARGTLHELVKRHGRALFELTFAGTPPRIQIDGAHEVRGNVLRVYDDQPAVASAALISRLGGQARDLRGVEIITPSLETVFLSVTGRRYETEGQGSPPDGEVDGERAS